MSQQLHEALSIDWFSVQAQTFYAKAIYEQLKQAVLSEKLFRSSRVNV